VIAELFDGIEVPEIPPNYNVAPTQTVAAIRSEHDTPAFAWLRWGLVPFWATDLKIGSRMINARCETVRDKPAFRAAFKKRRCLLIADGFYEWKKTADGKQPMFVQRRDGRPWCMAGLWEKNEKTGQGVETCAIITTGPNQLMQDIHDRMPVILSPRHYRIWLDPGFQDHDCLQSLLAPCPADEMEAWAVSPEMNKPSFNKPSCVVPIATQRGFGF
jgi:putative SOS response-associated peptidase YedK